MADEPTVASLEAEARRRMQEEIDELRVKADRVPALEEAVGFLREGFNRNTNTMYQVGVAVIATGVLGVLTALILKGVIG